MAYSLVGRSAPMAADDSDDDDAYLDGGEDDVRERTAWQDKHSVNACFGCGKTFGALTNRHHHCRECGRVVCGVGGGLRPLGDGGDMGRGRNGDCARGLQNHEQRS